MRLLLILLLLATGCRKAPRQAPAYSAAVTILDGPNACGPATSFIGSFLGGTLCATPAGSPADPAKPRVDFNFGGLAQASTPATYVHGYSLPTALSATNRFLAVNSPDGRHWALDRVNGRYIGIPGSSNAPLWDSATDQIMYYAAGAQWHKFDVLTGADTVAVDASAAVHQIMNGGSTHVSTDMWTTFYDTNTGNICGADLRGGRAYCASYKSGEATARVGYDFLDYTIATEIDASTQQRYIMLMASPALAAWTVDAAAGVLRFAFRGGENPKEQSFNNANGNSDGHCDPGENCLNAPHGDATSIGGVQYFMTSTDTVYDPCERDFVAMRISDGEQMVPRRVTLFPLGYCSSPYEWPDIHVGCTGRSGACVLSTETHQQGNPTGNQIIFVPDLAHAVKLAFHQSIATGSDSYWYSSRAALSWDARYIVFDSNGGQPDQGNGFSHNQVFMMPTGRK